MSRELRHVFQVVIQSPIEVVWQELTRAGVQPAFFGTTLEAEWVVDGPIHYRSAESGKDVIVGRVLEVQPPHRLVHTFQFQELSDPPSRVTYELRPVAAGTELTLVHDEFGSETQTFQRVVLGWPVILEQYRKLLESGAVQVVRDCPARS